MKTLTQIINPLVAVLALGCSQVANAIPYNINWLDMSATAAEGVVATGTVYTLPSYGNVRVDFTDTTLSHIRKADVSGFESGSITSGADNYSWTVIDEFHRLNAAASGTALVNYSVTFTFLGGNMPAGEGALSIWGLGRADPLFPSDITTATVGLNGTFLGDFDLGSTRAPTAMTDNIGSFVLMNSLVNQFTAAPGDPAFNSDQAIVRIDDTFSSITINMAHIGQDGLGFSVGRIVPADVPEPESLALLLLGLAASVVRFKTHR